MTCTIMMLSITILSIMIPSIMTFGISRLSKKALSIIDYLYPKDRFIVSLFIVMLNVVILTVVMLRVMVPEQASLISHTSKYERNIVYRLRQRAESKLYNNRCLLNLFWVVKMPLLSNYLAAVCNCNTICHNI